MPSSGTLSTQAKFKSQMAKVKQAKPNDISQYAKKLAARKKTRWYIMFFPWGKSGLTVGLEQELKRRKNTGEKAFEYFAPTYVVMKDVDGKMETSTESMLYNYFFVHTNENDLFEIKRHQPQYSVMRPEISSDGTRQYPFVSDSTIKTLQWVARSFGGRIPICFIDQMLLTKGDRIRITKGRFKGTEAHLVAKPGSDKKDIMVYVDNWMCVPLMNVSPEQYTIIGLNDIGESSKSSLGLDNASLSQELHEALCRFHKGNTTDSDIALAERVCREYADLKVTTPLQRCKQYAFLLPAYTVLKQTEKVNNMISLLQVLLEEIKSEPVIALSLLTIYGCTDNAFDYQKAHAIIEAWAKGEAPKKSKQVLINRLADYDKCFGH